VLPCAAPHARPHPGPGAMDISHLRRVGILLRGASAFVLRKGGGHQPEDPEPASAHSAEDVRKVCRDDEDEDDDGDAKSLPRDDDSIQEEIEVLDEDAADVEEDEEPFVAFDYLQVLGMHDVLDALGAASCEPSVLARLAAACPRLHAFLASPGFAARRAAELGAAAGGAGSCAAGCMSLEQLAVGMSVAKICSRATKNHVYFPYGGGIQAKPLCLPLLDGTAELLKRHEHLYLHIDAHTGAGAPAGIATSCAHRRAQGVMRELGNRGVDIERLSGTSWGKKVASVWSEPEDDTAARAELYFSFRGREFPSREAYYGLVPEASRPARLRLGEQTGNAISDDSDDGDDDVDEGRAGMIPGSFLQRLLMSQRGFVRLPGGRRVHLSLLFAHLQQGGGDVEPRREGEEEEEEEEDEQEDELEDMLRGAAGDDEGVGLMDDIED